LAIPQHILETTIWASRTTCFKMMAKDDKTSLEHWCRAKSHQAVHWMIQDLILFTSRDFPIKHTDWI